MLKKWIMAGLAAATFVSAPGLAGATRVIVDAGHGGKDPGAIGITGLRESEVNLDTAMKLKGELERRGYTVVLTRTTDEYFSLDERVDFATRSAGDIFVSVHANWYYNPTSRGTMVLYYDNQYPQADYPASADMARLTPQSRGLAQAVLGGVLGRVSNVNQGLVPSAVRVVRSGTMPSVLVETAFLSNAQDESMLRNPSVRQQLAAGIADGIQAFVPSVFPDLGGHWARDTVLHLKDQGIVSGYEDRFYPDDSLTRAEFVAILDRTGKTALPGGGTTVTQPSTVTDTTYGSLKPAPVTVSSAVYGSVQDVPPDHWAYSLIRDAFASGLLSGYEDGTILPDQAVTRAELAEMLVRFIKIHKLALTASPAAVQPFQDVSKQYWNYDTIEQLRLTGLIEGEGNRFDPDRFVSRAETAVVIERLINSLIRK